MSEREQMSQNAEMTENITEQQEMTKQTCTEDMTEQVVPCAEAKQEEVEDNLPKTDLLTEPDVEENKAETPTTIKMEEAVSTEEKQVEKEEEDDEAEDQEEDDGHGDGDEDEPEKESQTTQENKSVTLPEPKNEKPSLMNLNNEVVLMRKEVSRVRALLIRKLTRQITALKKKKGNENEVQKNQRRAARMVDEIHEMKALKQDVVTKIALQQEIVFDVVCRNPASSVTDRAIARIASHPQFSKRIEAIKVAVQAFREERSKNTGSKKRGDSTALRGKPKIADTDDQTQRKKIEGKQQREKQEMDEEEEGNEGEDDGVKQTMAEMTITQNRDFSGDSGSRGGGNAPKPLKKELLRNRKSTRLLKNTPLCKVIKKITNQPTTPEKCQIKEDTQESCTDKSEEDLHIKSPPLSEGAKATEDANDTVAKSDPQMKVPERKREVPNSRQSATAVNDGSCEHESVNDAIEEPLHKGSLLAKSDLKVHQGVEEEEEDDDDDEDEEEDDDEEESDLESDEEEESDSSMEVPMRSPDSESENDSEVGAVIKYSEATDLKKPLLHMGDKWANVKPEHESNQKMSNMDESDLESSDEDAAKEYFDDSTEERFRKRSSHSESESDDDFFLGKVSKFKKKKKNGGLSMKGGEKGAPPEPEERSGLDPGPSDSQESQFTSLYCQSLSREESGGGSGDRDRQVFRGRGGRFGGRAGMRGGGRGRGGFDSRPPRFHSRERGETAESDFSNAKHDFKSRHFRSDNRGRDSTGRGRGTGSGRGRNSASRQPNRSGAGFNTQQPAQQSLHPSWEASKKRKEQQGQIQAFQGKKIKFDD